jgi:uncharacterized protein (TIGR00730 family)
MSAICVYCASGPVPAEYLQLAAELGTAIGSTGNTLVSGGGNVSMMHREVADTDADELVVTDTMRERKQQMDDRADAFITLPGGIGTLEELFETWTAGYLGMHDKPVVLLDPVGHYAPMLQWLHELTGTGFVSASALDRLVVTKSVREALAACNIYL